MSRKGNHKKFPDAVDAKQLQTETVINENNGAQIKIKPGGTYKSNGVIYAMN